MTDTLLLVVIALLAANVLLVGVYIVLVLKEVRQTVINLNHIMESFATISDAISHPISQAPGIISAVTEGIRAVKSVKEMIGGGEDNDGKNG